MRKNNFFDSDDDDELEQQSPPPQLSTPTQDLRSSLLSLFNSAFPQFTGRPQPVSLKHSAEQSNNGLFDFLGSQSRVFDKVAAIFVFLKMKVDSEYSTITKHIAAIVAFGITEGQSHSVECPETGISRILGVLKELLESVRRMMALIEHCLLQTHLIYSNKKDQFFKNIISKMQFFLPLKIIGKGLACILYIDRAVLNNQKLSNHWNAYKSMLSVLKTQPSKFGTDSPTIKKLQRLVVRLDNTLLSGSLINQVLKQSLQQSVDRAGVKESGPMKANKQLKQLMKNFMTFMISNINSVKQPACQSLATQFLSFLNIYVLFRKIFQQQDRDTFKKIWNMQKRIPFIIGPYNLILYSYDLIQKLAPLSKRSDNLDPKNPLQFLQSLIASTLSSLQTASKALYNQYLLWKAKMNSHLAGMSELDTQFYQSQNANIMIKEKLQLRIQLIKQGLNISQRARSSLFLGLVGGGDCSLPINNEHLGGISRLMVSMQLVRESIEQNSFGLQLPALFRLLFKQNKKRYSRMLLPLQENNKKKKQKDRENVQLIAALRTAQKVCLGPVTDERLALLQLINNFLACKTLQKDPTPAKVFSSLKTLKDLFELFNNRSDSFNCSFLIDWVGLLKGLIKHCYQNQDLICVEQIFNSFQDIRLIARASFSQQSLQNSLKNNVEKVIISQLIEPLARHIDNSLRIVVHGMVNPQAIISPFRAIPLDRCSSVLKIWGHKLDLKKELTKKLNQQFYNMNIINLFNVEVYQQMRVLARKYYGLDLFDVYLPNQTLQQCLFDVLVIIRNFPAFIAGYKYILFEEVFLQNIGQSKMINSVGVTQIIESIRTHGLGIVNTLVNQSFKYLKAQFKNFSNFMFDQELRILLNKERICFRDIYKINSQATYSYQRAQALAKEILRIRPTDSKTHLDKFRELVTMCGNVLGFVRLLRTANKEHFTKLVDQLHQQNFGQVDSEWPEKVRKSAGEVDQMKRGFREQMKQKADFIQILLNIFKKSVSGDSHKHLKLFYLTVPLILNSYVNYVVNGKNQSTKRNSMAAFLADDGFFMGLSFFITILGQTQHFKALKWFTSVYQYYDVELKRANQLVEAQKLKKSKGSQLDGQISTRRLAWMLNEYRLGENNFMATNILFMYEQTK